MAQAIPTEEQPEKKKTFLSHVGTVAISIVKHVPTRALLWGIIAFFLGLVFVSLSIVLALFTMGRGAIVIGYFAIVMILIPFAGTALFAMHGLHRGAARAALDLEKKFGLVRWVVGKIMFYVEEKLGGRLANLPLGQFEGVLKGAIDKYLGSDDMLEGRGLTGWVMRRAKRSVVSKVETYTLAAYRAELQAGGEGGGISMQKVGHTVSAQLSDKLADLVMGPLNTQLWIFLGLYALVGIGWFHILMLVIWLIGGAKT